MRFGSLFPVPLPDKTAPFPLQVPVGAVVVPVGCLFFPGPFFSPPALCVSFSYVHLRYYTSSLMQRFGFLILHERRVRVGLREFGILKKGGQPNSNRAKAHPDSLCYKPPYPVPKTQLYNLPARSWPTTSPPFQTNATDSHFYTGFGGLVDRK